MFRFRILPWRSLARNLAVLAWTASRGADLAQGVAAPAFEDARRHAAALELAPALRLDVWAAEPQLQNGVAFSFDAHGRCYIAETHRYGISVFDITVRTNWLPNDIAFRTVTDRLDFLRGVFASTPEVLTSHSEQVRVVEDTDGNHLADRSRVFATGFESPVDGTAAGVLATGESVWFGNIPHLWKLEVPDEPAAPPKRQAVASGFGVHIGVTGHDLHGLIRGPDGRIYASLGDRGAVITNQEGSILRIPDCGAVVRCEPDGRNLELFCIGLRNPQELAFDDVGNLWTDDNDTAGADPCRVLHLVEGADYGWRSTYQHMPNFGPWVQEALWRGGRDGILPPAGTVAQGPSGLAWYPGLGMGSRLDRHFVHCDFPGGIWSFSVEPRGASYIVGRKEHLLWNCWPTDVDFGPDGALYVLDWIAGWQMPQRGRIYRLSVPGVTDSTDVRDAAARIAEGMAGRSTEALGEFLGHPHQRLRLEAQWELASRGLGTLTALTERIISAAPQHRRLHALWAVGQISRSLPTTDPHSAAIDGLLVGRLADPDAEVRFHASQLLGDSGRASPSTLDVLHRLRADSSPRVRFGATAALAKLLPRLAGHCFNPFPGVARLAPPPMAAHPPREPAWTGPTDEPPDAPPADPWIEHAQVMLELARFSMDPGNVGRLLQARTGNSVSPARRRVAILAARRLADPGIALFLADPDPAVIEAAGRAIYDQPVVDGLPALAALISRIDSPPSLHSRIVWANARLGTQRNAQMLSAFAKRRDPTAAARVEALRALGSWQRPPTIDPVLGFWRPFGPLPSPPPTRFTDPSMPGTGRSSALPPRIAEALARAPVSSPNRQPPPLPPDLGRNIDFETGTSYQRPDHDARRAFLKVAGEILIPETPDEYGLRVPGDLPPLPVQLATIEAAATLKTPEASSPLFDLFQRTNTPPESRAAIVTTLARLRAAQADPAIRAALQDPHPAPRTAAIQNLDALDGDDVTRVLETLLAEGMSHDGSPTAAALRSAQAAWNALGKRADASSRNAVLKGLQQLQEDQVPAALLADVINAARTHAANDPTVRALLQAWESRLGPEDPLARWRPALNGGDAAAGRTIFRDHTGVQCLRCHAIGGDGGTVGPPLDKLGARQSRSEVLESIVFPNARHTPGFQPAAGAPSPMPDGIGDILSLIELRDVIEFLATQR